jgi:hypothetical protein
MVIRTGKPDNETENEAKTENTKQLSHSIWFRILIGIFILVLLAISVTNLPGRYKAIVISERNEVLLLDTVKGNVWCYEGDPGSAVITYQGKLKSSEKVPERIFIK